MLQWAAAAITTQQTTPDDIQQAVADRISKAGGSVDYVSVTDAENLQKLECFAAGQEVLVAVAVFFGSVRLIDNIVAVQQASA